MSILGQEYASDMAGYTRDLENTLSYERDIQNQMRQSAEAGKSRDLSVAESKVREAGEKVNRNIELGLEGIAGVPVAFSAVKTGVTEGKKLYQYVDNRYGISEKLGIGDKVEELKGKAQRGFEGLRGRVTDWRDNLGKLSDEGLSKVKDASRQVGELGLGEGREFTTALSRGRDRADFLRERSRREAQDLQDRYKSMTETPESRLATDEMEGRISRARSEAEKARSDVVKKARGEAEGLEMDDLGTQVEDLDGAGKGLLGRVEELQGQRGLGFDLSKSTFDPSELRRGIRADVKPDYSLEPEGTEYIGGYGGGTRVQLAEEIPKLPRAELPTAKGFGEMPSVPSLSDQLDATKSKVSGVELDGAKGSGAEASDLVAGGLATAEDVGKSGLDVTKSALGDAAETGLESFGLANAWDALGWTIGLGMMIGSGYEAIKSALDEKKQSAQVDIEKEKPLPLGVAPKVNLAATYVVPVKNSIF